MAISWVLCCDRVSLVEKVNETRGGLALLTSSSVQVQSFGLERIISCLHQVRLKSLGFVGFYKVSQHGPLIFCFKMKSSNMLC